MTEIYSTPLSQNDYDTFLRHKRMVVPPSGFHVSEDALLPALFPFQRAIVSWALARGKAALFENTGMGKTLQQLEFARHVYLHTGGRVIILSPLAVTQQTDREAQRFGITETCPVTVAQTGAQCSAGITITNYERLHHFDPTMFTGIVADESGILKFYGGITRQRIIDFAHAIPFRLACTATPAPNDTTELLNHAEFLGIMSRKEILALFFKQDGTASVWRLRKHAVGEFWRWLASWAVACRMPSDLGYPDGAFVLPPLIHHAHIIPTDITERDTLFALEASGLSARLAARRNSVVLRTARVVEVIKQSWLDNQKHTGSNTTSRIENSASAKRNHGMRHVLQSKERPVKPICESGTERILPMCGNITSRIEKDGEHGSEPTIKSTQIVTKPLQNPIARKTLPENASLSINKNMASHSSSIDSCLSSRAADVQSAGAQSDCMLTTAMQLAQSEASYAQTAILPLVNSMMTPDSSYVPQNTSKSQWVVWCHLNEEQQLLERAFGEDCVSVYGSMSPEEKIRCNERWCRGEVPIMLTKPSIFGFGLNWQHCHHIAFVGLTDSWEEVFQATRRCWRFGQRHAVQVHVFSADTEGAVVRNIERKEREATHMMEQLVTHMKGLNLEQAMRDEMAYTENLWTGPGWCIRQGDCIELVDTLDDDSVGLVLSSPPFPSMYTYTNSPRDLGNVRSIEDMIAHFRFLAQKLLRVVLPGRHCVWHLTQAIATQVYDGYIGIKDFRGAVIRMMEEEGWIYYGEVCINKNPQVKAIRTHDRGLLFKTLATDSSHMHMALADYLLQFRKPGDNPRPIRAGISRTYHNADGWITPEEWVAWAAPVWMDIKETDVLNVQEAREAQDERHLCPLQISVCERAIKLWTAPQELVLDPFAGIGSVGYKALELGRQFLGYELKASYAQTACKNMQRALHTKQQLSLLEP